LEAPGSAASASVVASSSTGRYMNLSVIARDMSGA
jgi:hypothetical protein